MTLKEISAAYGVDAKLLKQYFQALANLYGICPLRKALQIYNRQNPEQKLTKEQLIGFADHYAGEWRIISPGDVYTNIPTSAPMQREIVHKGLVYYNDYDGYDYVRSHQADKEYYIPPKAELLKYARQEYYEETPQTADMAKFLRETMQTADWQRLLLEIILNLRFDHDDVQDFIDALGKELPNMESAKK